MLLNWGEWKKLFSPFLRDYDLFLRHHYVMPAAWALPDRRHALRKGTTPLCDRKTLDEVKRQEGK